MKIEAVLFDVVGTTVREKEKSAVVNCLQDAFAAHRITVPVELIRAQRGKEKREMISTILMAMKAPLHLTNAVLLEFKKLFIQRLHNFETMDGFTDVIQHLISKQVRIGIGTGLSADLFTMIIGHLHWDVKSFDYIGTAENAGRGRPSPEMINDMVAKLGLDPLTLLKVGDTTADIQEGKNAGVLTAAILSGTQPDITLLNAQPNFILYKLTELKEIVM